MQRLIFPLSFRIWCSGKPPMDITPFLIPICHALQSTFKLCIPCHPCPELTLFDHHWSTVYKNVFHLWYAFFLTFSQKLLYHWHHRKVLFRFRVAHDAILLNYQSFDALRCSFQYYLKTGSDYQITIRNTESLHKSIWFFKTF